MVGHPTMVLLNKSEGRVLQMKYLDIIALILLIVGGINWLLVGLFEYDIWWKHSDSRKNHLYHCWTMRSLLFEIYTWNCESC